MKVDNQKPGWTRALAGLAGLFAIVGGLLLLAFAKDMSMGMSGLLQTCYVIAIALILLGLERLAIGIRN